MICCLLVCLRSSVLSRSGGGPEMTSSFTPCRYTTSTASSTSCCARCGWAPPALCCLNFALNRCRHFFSTRLFHLMRAHLYTRAAVTQMLPHVPVWSGSVVWSPTSAGFSLCELQTTSSFTTASLCDSCVLTRSWWFSAVTVVFPWRQVWLGIPDSIWSVTFPHELFLTLDTVMYSVQMMKIKSAFVLNLMLFIMMSLQCCIVGINIPESCILLHSELGPNQYTLLYNMWFWTHLSRTWAQHVHGWALTTLRPYSNTPILAAGVCPHVPR